MTHIITPEAVSHVSCSLSPCLIYFPFTWANVFEAKRVFHSFHLLLVILFTHRLCLFPFLLLLLLVWRRVSVVKMWWNKLSVPACWKSPPLLVISLIVCLCGEEPPLGCLELPDKPSLAFYRQACFWQRQPGHSTPLVRLQLHKTDRWEGSENHCWKKNGGMRGKKAKSGYLLSSFYHESFNAASVWVPADTSCPSIIRVALHSRSCYTFVTEISLRISRWIIFFLFFWGNFQKLQICAVHIFMYVIETSPSWHVIKCKLLQKHVCSFY